MGLLGVQFCCQLAFGVLFAMAFVPKAPVGVLFYRVMGSSALAIVGAALAASLATGSTTFDHPAVISGGLAIVTYPFYSGPVRGRRWGFALGLALLGTALAVVFSIAEIGSLPVQPENPFEPVERQPLSWFGLALASLSALATGAVAGGVGLAMVLGHWYLTVPNLAVSHLARLNRVTVGALVASLGLLLLILGVYYAPLSELSPTLFSSMGTLHLGARVAVGLVLPLVFAWMVTGSLTYKNTRSATGILYASTVLVLIGAALAVSLQDTYGIPL